LKASRSVGWLSKDPIFGLSSICGARKPKIVFIRDLQEIIDPKKVAAGYAHRNLFWVLYGSFFFLGFPNKNFYLLKSTDLSFEPRT
jgi:hypothetical protein